MLAILAEICEYLSKGWLGFLGGWRQWNRRIWERESRRKLKIEREEQRNISRWQARNLELDCQQIVCTSIRSSERVWEGYTNTKWPVYRGPRGEEISGWHAVVRQEYRMMAARWFVEKWKWNVEAADKVDRCLARYSPRAEANNAIPCNTVRYNTIPCNAIRYNGMTWKLCDTIRYKAIPCSTIRCHAIQWKA